MQTTQSGEGFGVPLFSRPTQHETWSFAGVRNFSNHVYVMGTLQTACVYFSVSLYATVNSVEKIGFLVLIFCIRKQLQPRTHSGFVGSCYTMTLLTEIKS